MTARLGKAYLSIFVWDCSRAADFLGQPLGVSIFVWRGRIRSGGCSVGPGQIRTRIKLRHRGARPWLVTLAVPAETEQRSLFDGTRTSFL